MELHVRPELERVALASGLIDHSVAVPTGLMSAVLQQPFGGLGADRERARPPCSGARVVGSVVIRKVSVPPFFGAAPKRRRPSGQCGKAGRERPARGRGAWAGRSLPCREPQIGVRASLASRACTAAKCEPRRESCWRRSLWTYILRTGALHDITFGHPRSRRHRARDHMDHADDVYRRLGFSLTERGYLRRDR